MMSERTSPQQSELGATQDVLAALGGVLEDAVALAGSGAAQILARYPLGGSNSLVVGLVKAGDGFERRGSVAGALPQVEAAEGPRALLRRVDDIGAAAAEPLAGMLGERVLPGVVLTLVEGGSYVGELYLGFERKRAPSGAANDRRLQALARQSAAAVGALLRVVELSQRVARTSTLLEIARVSTSTLDLEAMLSRLVEAAAQLTGSDRASIWLLAGGGERLLPSAMYGVDESFLRSWKRGQQRLSQQPLSREALDRGEPVIVEDAATDPRTDKAAVQFFGDKSLIIVPLTVGPRTLGTLYLNNIHERREYGIRDIQIAQAIASQAASAIENARLYQESEQRREQLAASFRRLGDALGTAHTLDETLQLVAETAAEITEAEACFVELLDAKTSELRVRAAVGIEASDAERVRLQASEKGLEELLPAGVATVLEGLATRQHGDTTALLEGRTSYLGIPLSVDGRALGSLSVVSNRRTPFTGEDIELLNSFASGAALAIQRTELAAEAETRLRHLSSLYDLSQAVSNIRDFDETLAYVVNQAAAVLGVERCVLLLLDEAGERLTGHPRAYGLTPAQATAVDLPRGGMNASWLALESRSPFMSNECQNDPRTTGVISRMFGDVNLLTVPMLFGETAVGVIRASNKPPPGFTESDITLMSIFASQAAVIVQNATLFRNMSREAEQLEAIIAEASDGIVIVDSSGRISHFNQAMAKITGWPLESAIGADCEEVARAPAERKDDAPVGALVLKEVLRSGQSVPYSESVILSRDGRRVDVVASYSFIPSPWGESPMAVAIVRDISALREVERMKSDFVSLVSHELRTPLALVKGYIGTLLRPDLHLSEETVRRFQWGINEAADRLGLIVNNVLNTSRIESGLFRPNLRRTDLAPIVNQVVGELQASAHDRLEVIWRGDNFTAMADGEQIGLVLSNLVGNAIKYGRAETEMPIQIFVEEHPAEIAVTVRDRGPGIPSELRGHVFEKFFRGRTGQRSPGTGLGLYICRSVVEAHGGQIAIVDDSEPGTQIVFTVPRALPSEARRPG